MSSFMYEPLSKPMSSGQSSSCNSRFCSCGGTFIPETSSVKSLTINFSKNKPAYSRPSPSKPAYILSITFNISLNGIYTKTIYFPNYIKNEEAIVVLENYLSKPYSKMYFEKIKDDLDLEGFSYEQIIKSLPTKGDLLDGLDCLLQIEELEPSHVFIKYRDNFIMKGDDELK